jgi:Trypsin-co-occurring domain 1
LGLTDRPEEVALELGFSLKGEVGAVIAKTAAEGSFKLSIKWRPARSTGSVAGTP